MSETFDFTEIVAWLRKRPKGKMAALRRKFHDMDFLEFFEALAMLRKSGVLETGDRKYRYEPSADGSADSEQGEPK